MVPFTGKNRQSLTIFPPFIILSISVVGPAIARNEIRRSQSFRVVLQFKILKTQTSFHKPFSPE
ncbi:hypothetical protein SAMN05444377_101450 [Flavobacterium fontis]|uniref:Uncharacterized protein n=1 Tax=Flavobacterium fontis TaxID=1124188 RepID=A0A1M4WWY1_9FLAO|nr:hypothetical protein SAMN05444377_101450 [Flavobacterium fontis]